ncbi:MAG TPA: FG-GAP repeat protein [Phycisphaerae bacterium]|nr:FG-GAP repeat protein [Phycisphaerae bacterium]
MPGRGHVVTLLAIGGALLVIGVDQATAQCEVCKLNAADGDSGDNLGYAVSVSGQYAVVGAPFDDQAGEAAGSAYVFRRDDSGTPADPTDDVWIQQARLSPADADEYDEFGVTVAVSDDFALIGAPTDTDERDDPGAAYLFRRDNAGTPNDPGDDTWVQHAKLVPSFGDADDQFGKSVAISQDYALVGAIGDDHACPSDPSCDVGAAFVFRRDDPGTPEDPSDDTWVQAAKLFAQNAWRGADLGASVAISGDWFLAGSPEHNPGGQVHAFRRDDNGTPSDPGDDTWIEHAVLVTKDPDLSDHFGSSLSADGDHALIGAVWDGEMGTRAGAAYVFHHHDAGTPADLSDDTWGQQAKLTSADAAEYDWFGFRLSIDADFALVGALFNDDVGESSGSAYLFQRHDGGTPNNPGDDTWVATAKILSSNIAQSDHFGVSVALDGDYALIGAHGDDDVGGGSGSAYVYRFFGPPDCNANGLNDACDLAVGASHDYNSNGLPDECEAAVPTLSTSKMIALALLLATGGTIIMVRRGRSTIGCPRRQP